MQVIITTFQYNGVKSVINSNRDDQQFTKKEEEGEVSLNKRYILRVKKV